METDFRKEFRSGRFAIIEALQSNVVRLHETKSGDPRIVPLPAEPRYILEEVKPTVGPVFDDTNLRKEWRKACAAVGLGRIIKIEGKDYDPQYVGLTIHDLRRSAIGNLVPAGVSETTAMKISGHLTRERFQAVRNHKRVRSCGRDEEGGDVPIAPEEVGQGNEAKGTQASGAVI